ncbi:MAG: neutral/alkaline non-lysosomal ceramidase N-terminal domain-containing protein [Alphaproteobacteria bacterium]|nr:neutral/alkaline non-lysosomal ceramidase N-terminal domain-containing protein [Alphaproteobacteria bacterium]
MPPRDLFYKDRDVRTPVSTGLGLRAGAAVVDLTPPLGEPRSGWAVRSQMRGHHGRLRAHVLVLDDGHGTRVALIAADLHGGLRALTEEVATRVRKTTGIDVGRLWLTGSHTHSGPGCMYGATFYDTNTTDVLSVGPRIKGLYGPLLRRTAAQLADGITMACARLEPAHVGVGSAACWSISRNRSLPAAQQNARDLGKAAPHQGACVQALQAFTGEVVPALPDDRQLLDPRVQVVWARTPSGTPIGGWATFGMHAAMLPAKVDLCSPDLLGVAAERARDALVDLGPRVPLGVCAGSEGDVDPAPPGVDFADVVDLRERAREPGLGGPSAELETVLGWLDDLGTALGRGLETACRAAHASARADLRLTAVYTEHSVHTTGGTGRPLAARARIGNPTMGGSELGRGPQLPTNHEGFAVPGRKMSDYVRGSTRPAQWPKANAGVSATNPALDVLAPTIPLRTLTVGDHVVVGLPGECTTFFKRAIARAALPAAPSKVVVASLCGDYLHYLTTEPEYWAQHYEGSSTVWGRNTEHWLTTWVGQMVTKGQDVLAGKLTLRTQERKNVLALPGPRRPGTTRGRRPALQVHLDGLDHVFTVSWNGWLPATATRLTDHQGPAWVTILHDDGSGPKPLQVAGAALSDAERNGLLWQAEAPGVPDAEGPVGWRWRVRVRSAALPTGGRVLARVSAPAGAGPGDGVSPDTPPVALP